MAGPLKSSKANKETLEIIQDAKIDDPWEFDEDKISNYWALPAHIVRALWNAQQHKTSYWKINGVRVRVFYIDPDTIQITVRDVQDWKFLQALKNAFAGDFWEGVQLYPSEDRKHDQGNFYHIWCKRNGLRNIGYGQTFRQSTRKPT